jgi:hypothetical protein
VLRGAVRGLRFGGAQLIEKSEEFDRDRRCGANAGGCRDAAERDSREAQNQGYCRGFQFSASMKCSPVCIRLRPSGRALSCPPMCSGCMDPISCTIFSATNIGIGLFW